MHAYNGVLTILGLACSSCVLCFCKGYTYCSVIMCLCAFRLEKAIPEMTYTVSGGTLNPTHSLTLYRLSDIVIMIWFLVKKTQY